MRIGDIMFGRWKKFKQAFKLAQRLIRVETVRSGEYVLIQLEHVGVGVESLSRYTEQVKELLAKNEMPIVFVVGQQFSTSKGLLL